MKRTADQERAINALDRNVIVVAGAGSGKTSVLVSRYLALLDAHPDWPLNALVAITFTQKAAREMRDRVRQALEDRLAAASGPEDVTIWAGRVAAMDSARIDTIHGLCASILRANAAEANLDPDFTVMDETAAAILLDNTIDDVFRALVAENDPALELFVEYDAAQIRRALVDFIAVPIDDIPDGLLATWEAQWLADAEKTLAALLEDEAFHALAAWQPEAGWPEGDDRILDVWQNCHECLESLGDAVTLDQRLAALRNLQQTIKLQGGRAAVWGGSDVLEAAKAALRALRDRVANALESIGEPLDERDARATELLPLWVSLIRRTQAAYRDAKQAANALDFDDLEKRTRALLLDHPRVQARYRSAEFKHVLVDEFQDTNAAQWDIIQALADPRQPGTLFLVGDARQSIYAFRGADVSVFERVRRWFAEIGGEQVVLGRSFRTHDALLGCFNHVFARVLVRGDHPMLADYEVELGDPMDAARLEAPDDGPVVELTLIERERGLATAAGRRQEARAIAACLRRIVDEERRPIYDRHAGSIRPVTYGDVALLFQSMTAITVYEAVFKAEGIPFVTVAGRGYYDRQEVWDLIHLLRALYNPSDNLSLAAVLRSPMFSLSDNALLALRLVLGPDERPVPLWDALAQAAQEPLPGIDEGEADLVAFASTCLADLRTLAGRVTIADLLREALTQTGYLATLTGLPDGARRRGNVEKLLEKARQSGKVTLGAFSQYLYELSQREVREGEALLDVTGAVTLMSVHKSKGLEFPVVVLVDTSWKMSASESGLLIYDPHYGLACKVLDEATNKLERPRVFRRAEQLRQGREDAERRRLLYVAATRAQDYLLVSGQVTRTNDNRWRSEGWLSWLLDALELHDPPGEPLVYRDYPWGRARISFLPPAADEPVPQPRATAWDIPAIQSGQPLSAYDAAPPRLAGVAAFDRSASARSLTADQVADLGGIYLPDEGLLYRRRLRRDLLHDAPAVIDTISLRWQRVPDRTLVQIVRKALQWWPLSDEGAVEKLLRSYAWEEGIVDPRQLDGAVREAHELLRRTTQSEVLAWINDASEVYRDVPVVYRRDDRTVHGVVDVLLRRPDGRWVMIDFKTATIRNAWDDAMLAEHARRYHLQVGLFAAALAEQLSALAGEPVVPDVFIHYIRHARTLPVARADWESAVAALDQHIHDLLGQSP